MFDFDVYVLAGDGDLMEGVSYEAALDRRHLGCPTSAGSTTTTASRSTATPLTFTDDVAARFIGHGWNVTRVGDANDLEMLDARLRDLQARGRAADADRRRQPHRLRRPRRQDTAAAHGEPLGEDEVRRAKRSYGWPEDAQFLIPDGVVRALRGRRSAPAARALREDWERAASSATAPSIPSLPTTRAHAAPGAARRLGPRPSRRSRPTTRGWRPARRRARC